MGLDILERTITMLDGLARSLEKRGIEKTVNKQRWAILDELVAISAEAQKLRHWEKWPLPAQPSKMFDC